MTIAQKEFIKMAYKEYNRRNENQNDKYTEARKMVREKEKK
jgi:hypothetical protein